MNKTTLQQFEEKIREEFGEKHFDMSGGEPVGTEQITDFFLSHFHQKLLSFKQERQKIKDDLLKIADENEYEDMRREIIRYFNIEAEIES